MVILRRTRSHQPPSPGQSQHSKENEVAAQFSQENSVPVTTSSRYHPELFGSPANNSQSTDGDGIWVWEDKNKSREAEGSVGNGGWGAFEGGGWGKGGVSVDVLDNYGGDETGGGNDSGGALGRAEERVGVERNMGNWGTRIGGCTEPIGTTLPKASMAVASVDVNDAAAGGRYHHHYMAGACKMMTGIRSVLSPRPAPENVLKGRKRALLIGINYKRTPGARRLEGCVNDCKWMHKLLTTRFGFASHDIWVLTDEPADIDGDVKRFTPTKTNILNGMRWIVNGATPGSHCFWSFSGHGGRMRDTNGDEDDGWDETILPVDFPSAGEIVDDDIHEIMVKGLCRDARLTAVMDCCHSGTGMDLPFVHSPYTVSDNFRMPSAVASVFDRVTRRRRRKKSDKSTGVNSSPNMAAAYYPNNNLDTGMTITAPSRTTRLLGSWGNRKLTKQQRMEQRKILASRGEVILFSACADHQKSADAFVTLPGGKATGAMTFAFIEAIEHGHQNSSQYTYKSLLVAMREKLASMGHAQIPQLSTSHPWNLDMTFSL